MITKEQARLLKPGQRVRVLVAGCGDVDNELLHFAARDILTVDRLDVFKGCQGLAITVYAENGVVNVFDESDFDGLYPFEVLS